LRFVSRVGSGFDEDLLRRLHARLKEREAKKSPFRPSRNGENAPPRDSHYCAPQLVCNVRFSERTDDGGIRHPVFKGIVEGADPRECVEQVDAPALNGDAGGAEEVGGDNRADASAAAEENPAEENPDNEGLARTSVGEGDAVTESTPRAHERRVHAKGSRPAAERTFKATNLNKVFWPAEGYTKGDLISYYETIAPWMLPYLKDRPVVLTRYPDGIAGKSFFQKDAPGFAPPWIRTEKIYSPDSKREISYFVLESAEALAYMANMGAIPIHIWSSHFPHLERPDWLLFDIDPKNSTTEQAVIVARETGAVLREAGMRPYVKTSGQMGLHVVVGLEPLYTYEQAKMFCELVARVVLRRAPESATLIRDHAARKGRAYIDYMQLGYGKTIAGPFAARPVAGAPVSAPLKWPELKNKLDPVVFNIKTMAARMARLRSDPFVGALTDAQRLEPSLPLLEKMLGG
jgi:bifunctional non-homologous end joining protein LigD